MPKVLPGYSGGRLPGRNTKERGREEEEEDDNSKEKKVKYEIAHEVVTGIKEKWHLCTKMSNRPCKGHLNTVSSKVGDCSYIENEEEEEEDWQKEDQMEVQWAEDEKLEESLERRRREGSSLQVEVMQKST